MKTTYTLSQTQLIEALQKVLCKPGEKIRDWNFDIYNRAGNNDNLKQQLLQVNSLSFEIYKTKPRKSKDKEISSEDLQQDLQQVNTDEIKITNSDIKNVEMKTKFEIKEFFNGYVDYCKEYELRYDSFTNFLTFIDNNSK